MSDDFKYCSKCIHRDLLETDEPCKACIDEFFKSDGWNFIHFEEKRYKKSKEEDK